MAYKHEDYCTLLKYYEDRDILTRKLFDVNVRLFHASTRYQDIIKACCAHLVWCATTTKEGYKTPHGYSGANAGIPFNIIAFNDGKCWINPKIVKATGRRVGKSNCGSLLLNEPIDIWRYEQVTIEYRQMETYGAYTSLEPKRVEGYLPTAQHEIDHNNGILITDRKA